MARPYVPPLNPAGAKPREISDAVNAILGGKINAIGTVTLTPSSATTTLTDLNIGLDSGILFSPMTENARTEGSPSFSISARGSATLGHNNNAQADRQFFYVILG